MNIHKCTKALISQVKRVRLGRPGTSLKMGLLGMANIGKSSTFNILSNMNVPAQNIPFCTIDPNTAYISVKDVAFESLCKLYQPQKSMGPILRIVDIAGLVKGASQGYGLGNQFLSHLLQVDGLYHVVRAFKGKQVAHTEGQMDPVRDIKIIRHELIQKDLSIISRKLQDFGRKAAKSQDRNIKQQYQLLKKVNQKLSQGIQIRNLQWSSLEIQLLNKYLLLTSKPMVYLLNLSIDDYLSKSIQNINQMQNVISEDGLFQASIIPYSIEYQITCEKNQFSEVQNIIQAAYRELEICHFYTVGPDQVKAWAVRKGEKVTEAGAKIHSDFKLAFISAEVIHSSVLLSNPNYQKNLQKHSKKEGKNYIVQNGDILHFNCKKK